MFADIKKKLPLSHESDSSAIIGKTIKFYLTYQHYPINIFP